MSTSISRDLAKYVLNLRFQDLPKDVIHQAKRALLDTLACAIGGYLSESSQITLKVLTKLGDIEESTIIGCGKRVLCTHATVVNGVMVRYLDFMDTYGVPSPPVASGAHPCENIPSILAVGERNHVSGEEILTSIVAAYELTGRFCAAFAPVPLATKGWHHSTIGQYIVPLVVGKLMGLNVEQIVNAVGISGTHNVTLHIVDSSGEEYDMTKNIVYPFAAESGIVAAFLAQEGFTGPHRVIEGENSLVYSTVNRKCDLSKLTETSDAFRIMGIVMKAYVGDVTTQGLIDATLKLVIEHDIRPEDVKRVTAWVSTRCEEHTNDPVKRHPKNKESADHSSPYLIAMAITEREVGPSQFSPSRYNDPLVNQIIDKVHIEAFPEFDSFLLSAAIVEIETKRGANYQCRVDFPKGHPLNPLTDDELVYKFRSVATRPFKLMTARQIDKVVETVFNLDKLDDIGDLMQLLVLLPVTSS